VPRPKKFSDEEILEKMLDLEKKSPDGTISLSELARALIKEEHGKVLRIRKQSLSQRLDDKKRGKGLVQRGLVIRVGRRFKLTEAGRESAEAYRKIREEVESKYIEKIAETLRKYYIASIVSISKVKEEEKRLPLCYFLLANFLLILLLEFRLIVPKVMNKREFERELKRLWEKQCYSGIALKDIAETTIRSLRVLCGKHVGEIFDTFLLTLQGIVFFNISIITAPFESSQK
jgi:hypothetical protein